MFRGCMKFIVMIVMYGAGYSRITLINDTQISLPQRALVAIHVDTGTRN